MRTLALLLAIVGFSTAASIHGMNGHQLQEAMMKDVLGSDPSSLGAAMGFGTLMGQQSDEPAPEAHADDEGAAEREARGTGDKAAVEGNGHHPFPAMASMFPEMFGGAAQDASNGHSQNDDSNLSVPTNGNGHSSAANGNGNATPYSANGNGNSPVNNGNGNSAPANGNGHSKPGNGNGKPANGNRSGGAAAASATSISRGNGFSASQAQAFSFGGGSR